ncbi:MAG: beta-lactamase family protein [Gemmatimonadales bacterium]|nr:beta-lactamase family protein [Gemmatimonadales bacterium]
MVPRAPLCLALVLASGPGALLAQEGEVAALIARIEAPQSPNRGGLDGLTLTEVMQRFRLPAVSIAVVKDFKIHWARAYGIADVETGQLADTATIFQAGSISKPVFAMTAVKVAQEGRLSLDADVNTLLRSWQVPRNASTGEQPVTLRSLLSHTSGADDGFGFPGYNPGDPQPTLVQILSGEKPSNVGAVRFGRPPYTGFKYSGGGLVLAQLAVMDVVGRPFDAIARDLVLAPLGMRSSTYEQPLPAAFAGRAARGHSGGGRRMGAPWHDYPEQSAAGLWSTPSDLARFLIEMQRAIRGPAGAVLAQGAAREMLTPTGIGEQGLGLAIKQQGEGWYFSHSGSNWNFRADLVGHLRKGYGVVIMTNSENGWGVIVELEARIAAAYNWDSLHKPIPR